MAAQEAGLDKWEMVSSASRLYDWQASRLGSPRMSAPRRTDSDASQPDTLRQRAPSSATVMYAVRVLIAP